MNSTEILGSGSGSEIISYSLRWVSRKFEETNSAHANMEYSRVAQFGELPVAIG